LTGFGSQIRNDARTKARLAKPGTLRVVTLLCLVLLALFAVAQVAHVHSDESAADHCPLCISMHSAAPVEAAAAAVLLVQVGTPVLAAEKRAAVRNWNPKLFTRPPPAGC
jgi:hypothetical protein